ncbi:Hypothetical predicted protein [Octopus vulgaris]|uniref:Uncharacterized protein n=1 Tax=Octopus vulgaris TaxID=6645 RepID=A0AA36BDA4_OCTVU|nr:Hypothetical predicted protein [Octopus vulgaris]
MCGSAFYNRTFIVVTHVARINNAATRNTEIMFVATPVPLGTLTPMLVIWVQIRGKFDKKPHFITQPELNDLVRDLTLTKQQSDVLASHLQQWNLLGKDARVTEIDEIPKEMKQGERKERKEEEEKAKHN